MREAYRKTAFSINTASKIQNTAMQDFLLGNLIQDKASYFHPLLVKCPQHPLNFYDS